MTKNETIERAAQRAANTVGPSRWNEMTSFQRLVLRKQIAAALDDVGYFEIRDALEKIAKARLGEQMETCRTCENLIGIAKHALGGGAK